MRVQQVRADFLSNSCLYFLCSICCTFLFQNYISNLSLHIYLLLIFCHILKHIIIFHTVFCRFITVNASLHLNQFVYINELTIIYRSLLVNYYVTQIRQVWDYMYRFIAIMNEAHGFTDILESYNMFYIWFDKSSSEPDDTLLCRLRFGSK